MKKLFFSFAALLCLSAAAQTPNDVTRFLGIPIDGTKAEMIRQLKEKGFRSSSYDSEVLEGEFNGRDVLLRVVTNNNKVYRIMVADANTQDESSIRIRFNTLCRQFENNPKYISISDDQTIPDDENIDYEISANRKRYQAEFYQKTDETIAEEQVKTLTSQYTEEQLANLSEELQQQLLELVRIKMSLEKMVWFTINKVSYNNYIIAIYYDNTYNQANGEDL